MIIPDIALESSLWKKGFLNVAGVDEAGKGPWAGPVTAAAVIIHKKSQIVRSVRDSKKMTVLQREKAFKAICKESSGYGIGIISSETIDSLGIDYAVRHAMLLALEELEKNFSLMISYVIIDGSKTKPLQQYASQRIKKGGLYHYSIAAASVLAKVTRDRLMKQFAKQYPHYGFARHMGYGTKQHQKALQQFGPCDIHRESYAPIKALLNSI